MAIELLTPFTKVELEPEIKDKKRKQVGILGGNFNPVHNAHLVVADQVRQQLGLDKVLLMPEYEPPHVDKKETIDERHRLKMLELAIEGIEGLEIETIELERKGISYTYDTMKLLNERDPDTDYYFIIGADMVDYLPKWYRIDELVEIVQFVGVQRPRYKAGTSYPVIWVDVPLMDISSSMVREFINGRAVAHRKKESRDESGQYGRHRVRRKHARDQSGGDVGFDQLGDGHAQEQEGDRLERHAHGDRRGAAEREPRAGQGPLHRPKRHQRRDQARADERTPGAHGAFRFRFNHPITLVQGRGPPGSTRRSRRMDEARGSPSSARPRRPADTRRGHGWAGRAGAADT